MVCSFFGAFKNGTCRYSVVSTSTQPLFQTTALRRTLASPFKSFEFILLYKCKFCFPSQGKEFVTSSMKIISIIAEAVLANKVPDEEMTSIETTELSMTLGRYSPSKLVGITIEGGDGRLVLPESSISDARFVDSQV